MTETTPPEFNEIPEPTEPTGAPMEQEVAAAMTLMPETTAVGLASEPEVDFPESVIAPTLPTVQVLLHGANTNHFLTVLNVEPDGAGYLVHVRHSQA